MKARPRAKPNQSIDRGAATREKILVEAESIFASLGFATARLEDVAQAVGVKRASLVYYFRTKQEIYDEVEARIFNALQEAVAARLEPLTDPWERIDALIDSWFDFMLNRPTAAQIINRVAADSTPRTGNPVEYSANTLITLEQVIYDGIEKGCFAPTRPVYFVVTIGASILHFICTGLLYGEGRAFNPTDQAEIAAFRQVLKSVTRALLTPATGPTA